MKARVDDLAMLEYLRQLFQRARIQMNNRVAAIEDGRSTMDTELVTHFSARFQSIEDELTQLICDAVQEHEMWPWLQAVKGIGPTLAGALLAHIDITIPKSVSGLWRFAGQGVDNRTGLRDKPTKGEKLPYNAELKRICYLVESSFLRANSPYRAEYDEKRAYYDEFRTTGVAAWTAGHRDQAAKRAMLKLFLSHLWVLWRHARGLPILPPYPIAILHHVHVKSPWIYVPDYPYPQAIREHYEKMAQELNRRSAPSSR